MLVRRWRRLNRIITYDTVAFDIEYKMGENGDEYTETFLGYLKDNVIMASTIKTSFGYISKIYTTNGLSAYNSVTKENYGFVCDIYVTDSSIRKIINGKKVSVCFDGCPVVLNTCLVSQNNNLFHAYLDENDGESFNKDIRDLDDFFNNIYVFNKNKSVTMHIKITN